MMIRHLVPLLMLAACRSAAPGTVSTGASRDLAGDPTSPLAARAHPGEAGSAFLRGLQLLHSFEYDDAAEAFRAAQALDPDLLLAYWGEALTHCHPIWQEEQRDEALAVLARLAPTPEARRQRASDARERGLLEAVDVLFGQGTRAERAQAYGAAMESLHERYPDDLEIGALTSLAILGTATQGRDIRTYMRAAALAEEVLEVQPDHPGALHYAIHAYDDPIHAPLGLRMARRYGKVAPYAAHALHMPSHIYVALGMWDEAAQANEESSAAADQRRERKGLSIEERGYHSLYWLQYAYLQLGRLRQADQLLEDMLRDERASGSERTRWHLSHMKAARASTLDAWKSESTRLDVDMEGFSPEAAATELYVRGRAALERGEPEHALAAVNAMRVRRGPAEPPPERPGDPLALCCAPASIGDYRPGRQAALVMEEELAGLCALDAGARDEGLTRLVQAAEREDAMGYDFGPPAVVEPAHELLGWTYLREGQPEQAVKEFQAALRRAPRRTRSLQGLVEAARACGDADLARRMARELDDLLHGADEELRERSVGIREAAG